MKEFIGFYRWGLSMKFHMAIYTLALVFFKALTNLYRGETGVASLTMLQMMVACMILAILETALFPEDRELEPRKMKTRTALWVVAANVLLGGGALLLGWFAGVPVWMGVLLAMFLEGGLFSMWFGVHVALKKDTKRLNENLRSFQKEQ